MTLTDKNSLDPVRIKELKKFGFIMAVAMLVFGSILLWKGSPSSLLFYSAASLFLALALAAPGVLDIPERLWLKLGEKLSVIGTFVFIPLIFYVVVTPIGLIMRLLRKDTLGIRFDPDAESYWVPVEEDGPGTRPFTPY